MLEKNKRERIIALVNKEVVPAIGCTEPMAVALCTAKAATTLGKRPDRIEVLLSPNMLKNAMGVGIPGTGMIGLPIAVSLGALIGKPEYELEVLKDLTPDSLEQGKQYIKNAEINIKLKQGDVDKLYIEVSCYAGDAQATAIIPVRIPTLFMLSAMARWYSISVVVLPVMRLMMTSNSIFLWFTSLQQQLRLMKSLSSSRPRNII